MAFERLHHQRIARLLESLDADVLRAYCCWFGGGTAIALRHGEYRESVDVDFLVSDADAFLALRRAVSGAIGLNVLARAAGPRLDHEPLRVEADAIRSRVRIDDVTIKFEVVREARVLLDPPKRRDRILGVSCLTPLDMATTKLLANVDRGWDAGVFQRDLIDLAMMRPSLPLLEAALDKAAAARGYGAAVGSTLGRIVDHVETHMDWLDRCLQVMAMREPRALVWQRIRRLRRALAAR